MKLDLSTYEVLTFDCYGTLVDWESGIAAALGELLAAHGLEGERERLLELYSGFEPQAQAGVFKPYREVLAEVVDRFGVHFGFVPSPAERGCLADSLPGWPLFPDTRAALERLAARYRLAVLSNIDDDLFAGTARRLGVPLDGVITAQQVGSYKPAPGHFEAAMERLAPRERLLHVAQSLFHDVAVARGLGIATVWVNRRGEGEGSATGSGATPPSTARPDLEVPDLATLAALADGSGPST